MDDEVLDVALLPVEDGANHSAALEGEEPCLRIEAGVGQHERPPILEGERHMMGFLGIGEVEELLEPTRILLPEAAHEDIIGPSRRG